MTTTKSSWRYTLGKLMFLVPFPLFFITPIVVPFLGFSAVETAAIIGTALLTIEIVWFASIPLLGKEGFKSLKAQTFKVVGDFLKYPGKQRYYTGLLMLGIAIGAQGFIWIWFILTQYFGTEEHVVWLVEHFDHMDAILAGIHTTAIVCTLVGAVLAGLDMFARIVKALKYPEPK
ncbi:hypothetical protein [Paraferrimonas sp. SM1919]|uniref:hypothetical protein n=1 Tax=Paraferrimonas sp. SM1919 TaxID=2662263 RepID=UPI0013D6FAF3|nr:hypothetical protein [Paraferrimonas sp. SM1919]